MSDQINFGTAWKFASRFYWAQAYLAMEEKDFRLMRSVAKQAKEAEHNYSPDGLLLASIFGDKESLPMPPERVVEIGMRMQDDQIKAARNAVLAEMNQFSSKRNTHQSRRVKTQTKTVNINRGQ